MSSREAELSDDSFLGRVKLISSTSRPQSFKRSSKIEIDERHVNGVCFICDEKILTGNQFNKLFGGC